MNRKIIVIFLIVVVGGYFFWIGYLWKFFSCGIAGSDPCAEHWTLSTSESNLIKVIEAVKKEYPELNPPYEHYSPVKKRDYWYDFTFYYTDTNEEVQTWIREGTIALVALYPHVDSLTPINEIDYGNRKEINRDFSYFENKKQIAKFENKIISLIRQKINAK